MTLLFGQGAVGVPWLDPRSPGLDHKFDGSLDTLGATVFLVLHLVRFNSSAEGESGPGTTPLTAHVSNLSFGTLIYRFTPAH